MPFSTGSASSGSLLFRLPLELRRQIYSYLLPYSQQGKPRSSTEVSQKCSKVIWITGNIFVLLVCQQMCQECLDILYGTNTFTITITYTSIIFNYTWFLRSQGLTPNRPYSFLDHFNHRNVLRIKRFQVNVQQVDSYTGMIKYNCSGRGLVDGLRGQVRRFVDAVNEAAAPGCEFEKGLHTLEIRLSDGSNVLSELRKHPVHVLESNKDLSTGQTVLDPFRSMRGVRKLSIIGAVTPDYVTLCERSMTSMSSEELSSTASLKQLRFKDGFIANAARCRCALNRRLEFQAEGTPGVPRGASIESIRRPCPLHHASCDLFSRE